MRLLIGGRAALAVLTLISLPGALLAQDARPDRVAGQPNFNGVWQALNTANWNLEAHSATALDEFWRLGALAAIPAGKSVVIGGRIPYLPAALAQRDANRAGWPEADPETSCLR
jgi:hypothetical protein